MTCIVGLEAGDGRVIIGGDSAGVAGWSLTVRADEKVFTRGSMAFGFTSSFRMGQLLRYAALDLEHVRYRSTSRLKDPDAWMVRTFIPAVRDCLKAGGYAKTDNGVETGGTFLAAVSGRLYCVESDYQVGRAADGFAAVGCGSDIALGAMYATAAGFAPETRVDMALAAAERHSAGVRGPFLTVEAT